MQKIPIGISDFKTIIEENYLFIDKSMIIKEFLEAHGQTVLIPRPRRFGKTLNMSMIKYFFSNSENNSELFKGLNIENHKEIMEFQGKYPVIYLSFKDEKHSSFESFNEGMKEVFSSLFAEHIYCMDAKGFLQKDRDYFESILNKKANLLMIQATLKKLSQFIFNYYEKKVIILIDEYDVPIQSAYLSGYYNEAIEFMRNLLSGAFKDNVYLQKAMITGILRVARESIFSGLNNLKVESILSYNFSDKFGFTEDEIEMLTEKYGVTSEINKIKEWYNGYYFGKTTIYNPWSILNYLCCKELGLRPYWVNTSSNDLVNILLSRGTQSVKKELEDLISGKNIIKIINENIVMADIEKSSDNLWSFLLFTGYLKATYKEQKKLKDYYELSIPNLEVTSLYYDIIEGWFEDTIERENYDIMIDSLVNGDVKTFGKIFKRFVLESFSYFDVGLKDGEKVYHAFVLGMLISLNSTHEVLSNRESGYGRYDVSIIPRDISKLGIIIEFKKLDSEDVETMEETALKALKQIEDKKYEVELESRGIKNILKLGIVFKGKDVCIKSR